MLSPKFSRQEEPLTSHFTNGSQNMLPYLLNTNSFEITSLKYQEKKIRHITKLPLQPMLQSKYAQSSRD